jgi:hypothetical protein
MIERQSLPRYAEGRERRVAGQMIRTGKLP